VSDVPFALTAGTHGSAVVLLHGLGGNAASWQPQLDGLATHHRVLAWEMPGYGRSAPLPEMTFATVGDALAALLDAHGIDAAHLVGHSLGAMVAQEFALAHPGRVHSLALLAGSGRFGPPGGSWQQRFVAERLAPLDAGRRMTDIADDALPRLFAGPVDPACSPARLTQATAHRPTPRSPRCPRRPTAPHSACSRPSTPSTACRRCASPRC
jgi:pimeloyl-ACP methyl ester carboxylesterase